MISSQSISCLLPQGPVATSCLSSLVSLPSGAASGTAPRPQVRLTTQTLGEDLGVFRLRAGGHRHQILRGDSHSPWHCSQASVWADLFFPVTEKTKPRLCPSVLLLFGARGSCLLPGRGGREELLQTDPECTTVAFPHAAEGFD